MYILGDIGNSDTKIFLINSNDRILKRIILPTKKINNHILKKRLKYVISNISKIKKILFCSVVPNTFILIKNFFSKKTNIKCYEIKNLNLKSLLDIKVNSKQVGSDRLTNAISLINNKDNFIILDFEYCNNF